MRLAIAAVLGLSACGSPASIAWHDAEALWRAHDPGAWAAWRRLDAASDEGRSARRRLDEADRRYRRGVELLRAGQPGAREELAAGFAAAPMDPAYYLALARAYRDRDAPERAADLYAKFILYAPDSADVPAARAELSALDVGLDALFFDKRPAPSAWPTIGVAAVGLAGVALLLVVVLWRRRRRDEGRTLAELADENPELQPAIAFLVGCLRHELLKHRLLAVGDALSTLARGESHPGQRELLLARLYRGEPLSVAWAGHLSSFIRALGPRFDLQLHDPAFRETGRALAEVAGLEGALIAGEPSAVEKLARAHASVVALDAGLAHLLGRLTRSAVDRSLLAGVIASAGSPGEVDVTIGDIPADLAVELYRVDLELVLRNLVRNAIAAAARGPAPRRVAVDAQVELEATGEEIVRIRVRDSNPDPLPPPSAARQPSRGLGLVRTALDRGDGSLETSQAEQPFCKCVAVRLFRAMGAASEAA